MNEQAIKKLRRKFIAMEMTTLILVMLIMSVLIYLLNFSITIRNINSTARHIISMDGLFQDAKIIYDCEMGIDETGSSEFNDTQEDYNIIVFLQEIFGAKGYTFETGKYGFATRYFAVKFDSSGNLTQIITNHIGSLSYDSAFELGISALNSPFSFGEYGDYYYQCGYDDEGNSIVVYLESVNEIKQNNRLMFSAAILLAIGVMITYFVVKYLSLRAIAPEIHAAELQKRFITDASHELKTPLSVIKANTEMEEILNGENEWTQSTLRQVDRMNGLIKNLVTISRGQENQKSERIETEITTAVSETADTFLPVAKRDEKEMECDIAENVRLKCNDSDIRQLVSLLVDNAIKYCDDKGTVSVSLSQKGKKVFLKVSNSYKDGKDVDYNKFFERFYREDKSRNIDKGGYGIGLSIAEGIVKSYEGTIAVSWENGIITFQCILK